MGCAGCLCVIVLPLLLAFYASLNVFFIFDVFNSSYNSTQELVDWLHAYDIQETYLATIANHAAWAQNTNISDYNAAVSDQISVIVARYARRKAAEAQHRFDPYWVSKVTDNSTKRWLEYVKNIGSKLSDDETLLKSQLVSDMERTYSETTLCPQGNNKLENCSSSVRWSLEPDIEDIMRNSTDYGLLEYVWSNWYDKVGQAVRQNYTDFVRLANQGARNAGFKDYGAVWRDRYEMDDLESAVEKLMHELLPLYEHIHAYVRRQLRKRYPNDYGSSSAIPAHLLGNMWAQQWGSLYEATAPYANEESLDVTEPMKQKKYTPKRMFQDADDFFASMGLKRVPPKFWSNSMIVKPENRSVVCHASAWDFSTGDDYRIKMCTEVNLDDYITIHHEMGHVQYYMQYAHLPSEFRSGANPGFHEAIGDTIALAVKTPTHLRRIGLLSTTQTNDEKERRQQLNYLYYTALDKIAFLPFGYLVDLWRWRVFAGLEDEKWNKEWNDLRFQYQGIEPPVDRSNPANLDPGAKYHVSANVAYIRYFVSFVIQFQFYETLCQAAGHTGELSQCDFYENKSAGKFLAKMLSLGCSQPWEDIMQIFTGTREMTLKPLLRYFAPLTKWLEDANKDECFGWGFAWPEDVQKTLPSPRCGKKMP